MYRASSYAYRKNRPTLTCTDCRCRFETAAELTEHIFEYHAHPHGLASIRPFKWRRSPTPARRVASTVRKILSKHLGPKPSSRYSYKQAEAKSKVTPREMARADTKLDTKFVKPKDLPEKRPKLIVKLPWPETMPTTTTKTTLTTTATTTSTTPTTMTATKAKWTPVTSASTTDARYVSLLRPIETPTGTTPRQSSAITSPTITTTTSAINAPVVTTVVSSGGELQSHVVQITALNGFECEHEVVDLDECMYIDIDPPETTELLTRKEICTQSIRRESTSSEGSTTETTKSPEFSPQPIPRFDLTSTLGRRVTEIRETRVATQFRMNGHMESQVKTNRTYQIGM